MLSWLCGRIAWPLWEFDNGTRVLRRARALERSQWLPRETLERRQLACLQRLLSSAYATTDYYRDLFTRARITPADIRSLADLSRLPVLTKGDIQRHGPALISRSFDRGALIESRTGGSTGTALTTYADWDCRDRRNAAALRSDRWAGWRPGTKRAALWGNPPAPRTLRARLRRTLHDRVIYLDTLDMSHDAMAAFAARWRRYAPSVLFGHAHSLYIWARWLEAEGIGSLRPRGIISTSMMLIPSERKVIERVFGCRVTDRYGCEEVGLIACECERHDGLHLNADHLIVEILGEDGRPVGPGQSGVVVVTDLINFGMPLVRYRVEDVTALRSTPCLCGRGLPLIEPVTGRVADFLMKIDGSLVAGVSLIERTLTAFPGIEQMQLTQSALTHITASIVRGPDYAPDAGSGVRKTLQQVFGPHVTCSVVYVDRLTQQASGKYRFSICNVPRPAAAPVA